MHQKNVKGRSEAPADLFLRLLFAGNVGTDRNCPVQTEAGQTGVSFNGHKLHRPATKHVRSRKAVKATAWRGRSTWGCAPAVGVLLWPRDRAGWTASRHLGQSVPWIRRTVFDADGHQSSARSSDSRPAAPITTMPRIPREAVDPAALPISDAEPGLRAKRAAHEATQWGSESKDASPVPGSKRLTRILPLTRVRFGRNVARQPALYQQICYWTLKAPVFNSRGHHAIIL